MRVAAARGLLHGVGKKYSGPMAAYNEVPPTMSATEYVKAYGQIGWLYACVSTRAAAVASTAMHLYKLDAKSNQTEIFDHPALRLLRKPNPFLTGYKLRLLTQIYMDLTGEAFWVVERDRAGRPWEIWPVNPAYMVAVPDKEDHIKAWVYKSGSERIPIDATDVVHLFYPDPANPYRGIGPAQAAATDLDSNRYAKDWNKKFFYNSARPDALIEFKEVLDEEEYETIVKHWNESHAGVNNAHKVGMLEVGSYKQISVNPKDMDFSGLQTLTRDAILSIFGTPKPILGIVEDVNRANSESAEYIFARWTVKPLLDGQQDDLNFSYLPMFGDDSLEISFDDPTPENRELLLKGWREGHNKWLTTNEIREQQGMEPLEGGDVIYIPYSQVPMGEGGTLSDGGKAIQLIPRSKVIKHRFNAVKTWVKTLDKEAYWRAFVVKATENERQLRPAWRRQMDRQLKEILRLLDETPKTLNGPGPHPLDGILLDTVTPVKDIDLGSLLDFFSSTEELRRMTSGILPIIERIFGESAQTFFDESGMGLEFDLRNPEVERWINSYVARQIGGINETTRDAIRELIRSGEAEGSSLEKIKESIREYFGDSTERRLNTIVRTEVIGSSNAGTLAAYKQSGVVQRKEWLTAIDERTRDTHMEANGQVVGVNEDFMVGGGAGPAPGNIGLAGEDCNCRCTLLPVIE